MSICHFPFSNFFLTYILFLMFMIFLNKKEKLMKEATSQNLIKIVTLIIFKYHFCLIIFLIKIIIFFPIFSFQYNLENNAQVGLF